MESATILTPPSTNLSGILLSVRTQSDILLSVPKDQNMKKASTLYIDARGDVLFVHVVLLTYDGSRHQVSYQISTLQPYLLSDFLLSGFE